MENEKNMQDTKVRVVLYSRVASDTTDRQSLAAQKESLRQYAEKHGYTVVEEIAEVAKGSTLRRAGIRRLYQLGYNKAMDAVLVEASSRIARQTGLLLKFQSKLSGYGVQTFTRKEGPQALLCSFLSTIQ